jgi:hypothetical protein
MATGDPMRWFCSFDISRHPSAMRPQPFFVPDPSLAGRLCQTGLQKGRFDERELWSMGSSTFLAAPLFP